MFRKNFNINICPGIFYFGRTVICISSHYKNGYTVLFSCDFFVVVLRHKILNIGVLWISREVYFCYSCKLQAIPNTSSPEMIFLKFIAFLHRKNFTEYLMVSASICLFHDLLQSLNNFTCFQNLTYIQHQNIWKKLWPFEKEIWNGHDNARI